VLAPLSVRRCGFRAAHTFDHTSQRFLHESFASFPYLFHVPHPPSPCDTLGGPLHPACGEAYQQLGQFYHEAAMMSSHHGFPDHTWPVPAASSSASASAAPSLFSSPVPHSAEAGDSDGSVAGCGVRLAAAALRCYREALRRQAFGAMATGLAVAQAADSTSGSDAGDGSCAGLTSSPAFLSVAFSRAGTSGGSGKGGGCLVPLLGADVLAALVSDTTRLVEKARAGSSSSSGHASDAAAALPLTPSPSATAGYAAADKSSALAVAAAATAAAAAGSDSSRAGAVGSEGAGAGAEGVTLDPAAAGHDLLLQRVLAAQSMHTMALL